jgi:hypothetical protein
MASNRPSQYSTKGTGQYRCGNVDCKAFGLLFSLIPRRDDEEDTRGEAAFENAHNEP